MESQYPLFSVRFKHHLFAFYRDHFRLGIYLLTGGHDVSGVSCGRFNDGGRRSVRRARFVFEEFIQNRTRSPRLAAAYIYLASISEKRAENRQTIYFYEQAETLLKDNPIQMAMFIEEASALGHFHPTDDEAVMRFLKAHQKWLSSKSD